MRWPVVAAAAGFRRARRCEGGPDLVCQEAQRLAASDAHDGKNLYRVLGTVGDWLVLRLN